MKYSKTLSGLAAAAALVIGCGAEASAQRWDGGPVVVYDQRNGGGTSQAFNNGEYLNNRGQFGSLRNDSASSVSVDPGYRVRFCEAEGRGSGSGRCEEFGEGYHNLRYANSASYIRVWNVRGGGGWNPGGNNPGLGGRGVTVYDDRDYRGASQTYGPGRYLNSSGQLGRIRNDEASSIRVDRGFRVRLCESEGGGFGSGQCEEYNEGSYNLRLNDEASYIEVRRAGGGWIGGGGWNPGPGSGGGIGSYDVVVVYSESNQRGEQQTFGVGTFRNDLNQFGSIRNDDATSISVPRGYRVRICENEGGGRGGGRCEEYGQGQRNLRYNDTMSWIRVWRSGY